VTLLWRFYSGLGYVEISPEVIEIEHLQAAAEDSLQVRHVDNSD
jgi:hypothetical protein